MKIDDATVLHIARLARIRVDDAQAKRLVGELTAILQWVEQLNEVDTSGVEPMSCVIDTAMTMREDEVTDGGYPQDIVKNAAERADRFFVVPKVVE